MLKIGDTVRWSGCWGTDKPQNAIVQEIDVDCNGCKEGRSVTEVFWSKVTRHNVVVGLDNGNWAYGNQIKRLQGEWR